MCAHVLLPWQMAVWGGDSDPASGPLFQSWPRRVGSLRKPQEIAELLESALGASGKTILPADRGSPPLAQCAHRPAPHWDPGSKEAACGHEWGGNRLRDLRALPGVT